VNEAVTDAVNRYLDETATNAIGNAILWQAVHVAVDAYEEHVASTVRRGENQWVICYMSKPLVICATRQRARRRLKSMLRLSGQPRSNYTIYEVDQEVSPI
jgi:hypothetical protein